ncbi:hypothetical protein GWI33_009326, partial [Rhynchophorus ferrugineus]
PPPRSPSSNRLPLCHFHGSGRKVDREIRRRRRPLPPVATNKNSMQQWPRQRRLIETRYQSGSSIIGNDAAERACLINNDRSAIDPFFYESIRSRTGCFSWRVLDAAERRDLWRVAVDRSKFISESLDYYSLVGNTLFYHVNLLKESISIDGISNFSWRISS